MSNPQVELDNRSVLILGATGYIGGSALVTFIRHYPNLSYSAIVRSSKDVAAVEALGVKVIQGDGLELVEKASSQHDVVANFIDADNMDMANACIKGLLTRAKTQTGIKKPIYLHTSGTGLFCVSPDGTFRDDACTKIWDDSDVDAIRNMDPKAPHRNVDLQIFAAGETGLIDTYLVAPSTIYGRGIGPVRYTSIQVNGMIRLAVQKRQVYQVGPGTNIWNYVHVEDIAQLFTLVLGHAITGNDDESPYGRFYTGCAGEFKWGDVASELARIMKRKGLVDTEEVKQVSLEKENIPELLYTAATSRAVSTRAKALGWKPEKPGLLETLEGEVEWTVEQL